MHWGQACGGEGGVGFSSRQRPQATHSGHRRLWQGEGRAADTGLLRCLLAGPGPLRWTEAAVGSTVTPPTGAPSRWQHGGPSASGHYAGRDGHPRMVFPQGLSSALPQLPRKCEGCPMQGQLWARPPMSLEPRADSSVAPSTLVANQALPLCLSSVRAPEEASISVPGRGTCWALGAHTHCCAVG